MPRCRWNPVYNRINCGPADVLITGWIGKIHYDAQQEKLKKERQCPRKLHCGASVKLAMFFNFTLNLIESLLIL